MLDVGAGSGRDARYLSDRGLSVVAVEPAEKLLEAAKVNPENRNIHWLRDALPELNQVFALQVKFDPDLAQCRMDAYRAIQPGTHLSQVAPVETKRKMVISLRHGVVMKEPCIRYPPPSWRSTPVSSV